MGIFSSIKGAASTVWGGVREHTPIIGRKYLRPDPAIVARQKALGAEYWPTVASEVRGKYQVGTQHMLAIEGTRESMGLFSTVLGGLGKVIKKAVTKGKAVAPAAARALPYAGAAAAGAIGGAAIRGGGGTVTYTAGRRRRRKKKRITQKDIADFMMMKAIAGPGFMKSPAGQMAMFDIMKRG